MTQNCYDNDKVAGCGGDELPVCARARFENPVEISRDEFFALMDDMRNNHGISAWGSVINNRCDIYTAPNGRIVEVYLSFGWFSRYYTEGPTA